MTLIELLERVQVALASGVPEDAQCAMEGGWYSVGLDTLEDLGPGRSGAIWHWRNGAWVAR